MNYLLSAFKMSYSHKDKEDFCQQNLGDSTESLLAPALKMQVILRIRPASPPARNKNQAEIYVVENPMSLLVRNCHSSESARRSKANDNPTFKKFTFDQIFNPQIDQAQFFSEAIKPTVIDFLNNQNSSVISYGSADAGKTYTLFGPIEDPGIIPRSIEFTFSLINCTLSPWYKPEQSQGVVSLDEPARDSEVQVRKKLLSCRLIDKAACEEAYNALQDCQPSQTCDAMKDSMFSLWISFIEIYNDSVSDLLAVDEDGKNMPLKLSTDKHGSTYVQGMQSVCATTGLEAYEILNAGQMRLSTVSASNYKSSRSHSIFTMRLLKYDQDSTPSAVQMSTISFYDLAGPGKMQKSASSDKQLKESRSINTSLLAFGRCLKALAEGHSRQSTGPFRDSKLTRLFQHSLRKENLIILINLNPTFELFAETQNVLNFASTAVKLTSEFAKEDKRLSDYQSPVSSPKLREARSSIIPRSLRDQEINEIVAKNKQLLDQIKELKSAELSKEYKLRQDLADFYTKQLNDLEEIWKNRMSVAEEEKECLVKFSVDRVESYYKCRLDEHLNRKRKRIDREPVGNVPDGSVPNDEDKLKVKDLEKLMKSIKDENEQVSVQNKQYAVEVSWLKDNLKRITDFIWSSEKCDDELIINDFSAKNFQYFTDDTILHIQSIVAFVKESYAKEQVRNEFHKSNLSSKEVQCNMDFTLLDHHCEEIEELFRPTNVSLPQIDDSLDSLNEIVDQQAQSNKNLGLEDLVDRLSRIKELIAECLSNQKDLEIENNGKEEELRLLRRKVEEQDIDILRMKQQHAESESVQLLLLKKCESLEMVCKSKEFFKNLNFDAVESENSLSCAIHQEIISLEQSNDNYQTSTLDLNSVNAESNATTSSSDSSKNDSGVAFSLDSVVREEKHCQTDIQCDEDNNGILKEKLMKLNLDYTRMEAQHLQGSTRITELSLELERIRDAMVHLKENTFVKDRTITECQSKLNDYKVEIDRLNAEKKQLESKFDELRDNLLIASKDYERKLAESQVKLRAHEEGEHRTARCLKDYWEKSVNLGSELSIAYSELEKYSIRCYKEHVLKIRKLEEELNEKKISLTNLNEQMGVYEKDLAEMIVLSGKVDEFEGVLSRLQKDKVEVEKIISSKSETQLIIQNQMQNLTEKIGERDGQILSLKWQLDTIIKANLSNSRKAKELGRDVKKLIEKICLMKEDMTESETARTDLERKSAKEIDNLRARLTIFEGNADLLNLIRNSDESKQCEMDKLKLKVLEKEKELEFLKKNRNATIQRYECLVQQLQNALKMNNHSNRMKKVLPYKQRYFFNDLKETTSCYVHGSDPQVHDWKVDEKSKYMLPCSGVQINGISSERNCRRTIAPEIPNRLLLNADENQLEAKAKIDSVFRLSRKDVDTAENDFDSSIEESCCEITNFPGNEVGSQN